MSISTPVLDDMVIPIDKITILDKVRIGEVRVCHLDACVHNADQDTVARQAKFIVECVDVGIFIRPFRIRCECTGEQ